MPLPLPNVPVFILVAAAAAAAASAPALAQQPPGDVQVVSATYSGTGCRPGTAVANVSPDGLALTLLFSDYVVEAGNSGRRERARKSCNLDVRLRVPTGWTFGLYAVDYRGYVALDAGAAVRVDSKIAFPPSLPMTHLAQMDLSGPLADDYVHRVDVPVPQRRRVPCAGPNRHLKIQTDVEAEAPAGGRALATVDSVDGEFHQTYRLEWRRCE